MARPRKDQQEAPARERIEQAFWSLLEETAYRGITVRALCQRAGVNHNTFYYHFNSIDDLAMGLIDSNLPHEAIAMFIHMVDANPVDVIFSYTDSNIEERWNRFRLALSNGGLELRAAIRDRIAAAFVEEMGIDVGALDAGDRAKLNFAFAGICAVVSSKDITTLAEYREQLNDGIGEAVAPLLQSIVSKHVPAGTYVGRKPPRSR